MDKEIIRRVSKNQGGSLSVVIPPALAKICAIKGGDYVRMEASQGTKDHVIVLRKLKVS